jgi:tetratricopeptide (TPR) repeat protein
MRVRLAEVYIRLGKKNDAWQIFTAAAETLRNRGSRGGAEEILQRMLTLDPGNSYALLLRARNAIESGDAAGAIPLFQKVHDLDSHPDGMRDLLKAYLQTGRVAEAGPLAAKLLNAHNDTQSMFSYVDALLQNNAQEDAIQVIEEHADRLLTENSSKILETLRAVIGPLGSNPPALEKVLALFHKAGDQSHDTEVHELLAHASVQSGDLARARELYQGLTEEEPQNPIHMQNYQQVVGMMGGSTGSKLLSVEEGIVLVEELEATAPPIDQEYSPEIASALRAAITDTELFVSYNMPDKALGPLMAVLPIAPSDVRLNQRLAALYVRCERFAEAAACCRTLASVYNEAGLSEEGSRYEDLAQRCEEHASAVPGRPSAPLTDEAEIPLAPWPMSSETTPQLQVAESEETTAPAHHAHEPEETPVVASESSSEIDLSDEWDGALTAESAEATVADPQPEVVPAEPAIEEISVEASDAVAETIEEIRFYLEHSMVDQARAAFVKLQSQTADYEQLAAIQAEIDAAVPATPEVATVEEAADEIPEAAVALEEPVPTHEEPATIPHEAGPSTPLQQMVAELDSSLGDGFLPDTVHHEIEQEQEITAHAADRPGQPSGIHGGTESTLPLRGHRRNRRTPGAGRIRR